MSDLNKGKIEVTENVDKSQEGATEKAREEASSDRSLSGPAAYSAALKELGPMEKGNPNWQKADDASIANFKQEVAQMTPQQRQDALTAGTEQAKLATAVVEELKKRVSQVAVHV